MIEKAIEPLYATARPNDSILLFRECDLELRTPWLIFGKGKTELWWAPTKAVRFELDSIAGTNEHAFESLVFDFLTFGSLPAILNVPTIPPMSWDVIITKANIPLLSGNLGGLIRKTRLNGDDEAQCDELKFHIVNLDNFIGTSVMYPSKNLWPRRIVLSDDKWEITIDGVENLEELIKGLDQEGGFAITHVGVLKQRCKKPFKVTDAIEQMGTLGNFLSFVEGRWCFPILLVGTRKGEIVFRDLSARRRIDQWKGNWRWSPMLAKYLDDAYKGFASKWNDPKWRKTVATILEFYTRANTYPTVELSVLDSFTALDRLASAYSLEEVTPASKRIRQALAKGGLNNQSPEKELYTFYEDFYKKYFPSKSADCATILTDFRNGVVHGNRFIKPNDKWCRPKLDDDGDRSNPPVPSEIKSEARQLGLWCVEMSLLYLIGYNGLYNDRLTGVQDVQIHWSKPK
ncbi:MAG: hypothetical protein ABR985_12990 [Methanotrichaceae archaeon]